MSSFMQILPINAPGTAVQRRGRPKGQSKYLRTCIEALALPTAGWLELVFKTERAARTAYNTLGRCVIMNFADQLEYWRVGQMVVVKKKDKTV